MLATDESDIIEKLHTFNHTKASGGYAFALAMRDPQTGNIEIHERSGQPCYGEMRKYKNLAALYGNVETPLHGDECTQPDDHRPSDLHYPFPAGIPEAVAVSWRASVGHRTSAENETREFMLSDESPWRRGFGEASSVFLTKKNSKLFGAVFTNTDIDPTVLVNCWKSMAYLNSSLPFMQKGLQRGLTRLETLLICGSVTDPEVGPMYPSSILGGGQVDLRRVSRQDPHDFTGGTFRNRYDYSRKKLMEIFKSDDPAMTPVSTFPARLKAKFVGHYRPYNSSNPFGGALPVDGRGRLSNGLLSSDVFFAGAKELLQEVTA